MKKNLFYSASALLFTLVVGCLPINTGNLSNGTKTNSVTGQPPSHPYYGKIDISLDTSLINYSGGKLDSKPRRFVLNDNQENTNDFKIESFNIPEIPYIKSFKIESQEKEVKSNFTIRDKTRKYYLIATKIRKDDKLDISINGIPQINSSDYDSDDHVVVKPIIINESNDISIKYSGKIGDYIAVSIVEGSKVETVRKKISGIKWEELTEGTKGNNFFNPNDLTSLGGLKPYEGDKIITSGNNSYSLGVSTADDTTAIFKSGYVAVTLRNQSNLQALLQRTKATVDSVENYSGNNIAVLKINYDQTNLLKLSENLKILDTFSQAPIKRASFSSINSAKTIATFIDLLVNDSDLISNAGLLEIINQNSSERSISPDSNLNIVTDEDPVSLNKLFFENTTNYDDNYQNVQKQGQVDIPTLGSFIPFYFIYNMNNHKIPSTKSFLTPTKSIEAWWLTDTSITKAWKYSLGQNTKVGIFDTHFSSNVDSGASTSLTIGYLASALNIPRDISSELFKSRLEFLGCPSFDSRNKSGECLQAFEKEVPDHGFEILSLIGSDSDDKKGSVGVAPRAKISLFGYQDSGDGGIAGLVKTLNIHINDNKNNLSDINNGLDVINISSGKFLSLYSFQQVQQKSDCILTEKNNQVTNTYLCDSYTVQATKDIRALSNTKIYPDGSINPDYVKTKKSIIFVSTAGNDNKEILISANKFFFPGNLSNVINVGAYELQNIDSGTRIRGDFFPKSFNVTTVTQKDDEITTPDLSSNYGAVDIWAPGDNLVVNTNDGYNDAWSNNIFGTSFSSPITAGIISLLKSLKPDLDVNEVRKILQDSGNTLRDQSFKSSVGQKSVNAEAAVKLMLTNYAHTDPAVREAQSINAFYTGLYGHGQLVNKTFGYYKDIYPNSDTKLFYPDLEGKDVKVTGWYNDNSTFTVLQMRENKYSVAFNDQQIPVVNNGNTTPVVPGDIVALHLTSAQTIDPTLTVELDGRQVPVLGYVQDYLAFKIPFDISQGTKDIIIKAAGGNNITFSQALKILDPTAIVTDRQSVISSGTGQTINNWKIPFADNMKVTVDDVILSPDSYIWDNTNSTLKVLGYLKAGAIIKISVSGGAIIPIPDTFHKIVYTNGSSTRSFSIDDNKDQLINNQSYRTPIVIAGGKKLAYFDYSSQTRFYITNVDGSNGYNFIDTSSFPSLSIEDNLYGNSLTPVNNIFSSEGTKVLGTSYNDSTGTTNIALCNGSSLIFPFSDSANQSIPRWSNDDKYISFISQTNNSYSLNILKSDGFSVQSVVQAATPTKLFEITDDQIIRYVWSPDSSKIIFETKSYNNGNKMYLVDVNTKVVTDITPIGINSSYRNYGSSGSWFPNWINNNEILFTGISADGSDNYQYSSYYGYINTGRGSALFRRNINNPLNTKIPLAFTNNYDYYFFNNPIVSPDGRYVILHGYIDCSTRVYYVDLNNNKINFLSYGYSGGWIN